MSEVCLCEHCKGGGAFIHNICILDKNTLEDFMRRDPFAEDDEDDDLQDFINPKKMEFSS